MNDVPATRPPGRRARSAGPPRLFARLRSEVERSWSHGPVGVRGAALDSLLAPPSWIWRGVTWVRNAYHDRTPARAVDGVRVVSIGNLVAGGTGKTPMTRWVVDSLLELGHRPAVALRGYGGDEALLHRRWHPGVPVCVDADRVRAVREARARGAGAVVVDDGFQHRRLARDLDVVLLAAEDRFPGRALPRGPYREQAGSLARADGVVVTRRVAPLERARALTEAVGSMSSTPVLGCVHIRPGAWLSLAGRSASAPEGDVLVVSAVARPEAVASAVREATPPGTDVEALAFADHHAYSEADVAMIRRAAAGRTLVVTEKDAVKLEPLETASLHVRVLSSEIVWDWGEETMIAALARAMRDAPA